MELVPDYAASRRAFGRSDMNRGGLEPKIPSHENLTGILGPKIMQSETESDISTFAGEKSQISEVGTMDFSKRPGRIRKLIKSSIHESNSNNSLSSPIDQSPCQLEITHGHPLRASDGSQSGKVKLLCSFGGKILPRPTDGKLRYVGGEARIISIRRDISWQELMKKTHATCNQPHFINYQLPGEDLDALVSVSSDEDLQNMMEEYHGTEKAEESQRL